jgi:PKD repeat protein
MRFTAGGDLMGGSDASGQVGHNGSRKILSIGLVVLMLSMSLAIAIPSMSALLVRTEGAPADLDFTYEPSDPNTGTIVNLMGIATDPDGDALVFSWDFGDGYLASGQTVSHQFMNGSSTVTMFVDDGEIGPEPRPLSATKMIVVTENSPPTISVPSNPVVTLRKATAFAVAYVDNDSGDSHRFTWFWGDGGSIVTSIPQAQHVYTVKGVFNMTVYCDDLTGLQGHNVSGIGVNRVTNCCDKAPVIVTALAANVTSTVKGWPVSFSVSANDIDGDMLGFMFEFGDGEYAFDNITAPATATAAHTYTAAGYYDAYVTVTDYQLSPLVSGPVTIVVEELVSIHLLEGWNLVCIPLVGHDYRASTLGLSIGDVVVGPWNSSTKSYASTYVVGLSPPILDFSIVPGLGYWIHAGSVESLSIKGVVPTGSVSFGITVPAGGGWALMGFLGLKTHHASEVPLYFSGMVSAVAKLQLPFHTYQTYVFGVPPTDFAIYPGEAFFMYCNSSGTFSYIP